MWPAAQMTVKRAMILWNLILCCMGMLAAHAWRDATILLDRNSRKLRAMGSRSRAQLKFNSCPKHFATVYLWQC